MKVILLQDVPRVGRKYDVANVAPGYARNFLLPRELAEFATEKTLKQYQARKDQLEKERALQTELLAKNIEDLADAEITVSANANEQGGLYASIHAEDIVPAIKEQTSLDVDQDHIQLEGAIKETGEHKIDIAAGEKSATITLKVTAS